MYKIRNKLIKVPDHIRTPVLETLKLYDAGQDITNSPLIQSETNMTHIEVYEDIKAGLDKSRALVKRQDRTIDLYENIKANGFNGSRILCYFNDEGDIKLYDGCHRLAILEYLNIDTIVNVEIKWNGIDGRVGKDFPLVDVLLKEAPGGKWTYQPVSEPRLEGWKVDRFDAEKRLEYILSKIRGSTVLDIGCSEGYYARELAERGYKVTAIDRSKGLVAAARYLTILEGLEVDYHVVNDWAEFVTEKYDVILFLAIIHNDMKSIGVEEGLEKLKTLKGKADMIFMEVPNDTHERGWGREKDPQFSFHKPESVEQLEEKLGMKVTDKYNGRRTIYTLESSKEWWSLGSYLLPERSHYQYLYQTLKSIPCRNIMEIGTYNGNNAVVMIKAASKKVPENEINYYGFDLFEGKTTQIRELEYSPMPQVTLDGVTRHIMSYTEATIKLFKGNTKETLKKARLPQMDLIYIDGGHSIETIRNDWKYAQKFMGKDTVVYFDDYNDEMAFLGPKFIIDELDPKYEAIVMPSPNYYKRPFGRFKSQLLKVQRRKMKIKKTGFRIHILGLPHSKTIKDWGPCAFTHLVYRFCEMMTDMGYEVYHYGTEGSNPPCTEQIDVLTPDIQKQAYGDWDPHKQLWIHNGNDLAYTTFRKNAIPEVVGRRDVKDLLLISNGLWLKEVSDKAGAGMAIIEPFVGYLGCFSKFRVFPSYNWMHHIYGIQIGRRQKEFPKENFSTGQWYDAVIPHFFNPADYTFRTKKEDYFIYTGRLIQRKGIHIAAEVTKKLGAKLKVAGQVMWPNDIEKSLAHVGCNSPHVEYLGVLDQTELNDLRSKARAMFVPSMYMEPFGLIVPESYFCGTPVITTDWGAFPEIVLQGETGFRCRTMDDFTFACNNIHKISPKRCREYAEDNFSMARIGKAYEEYFTKVTDLFSKGWYTERPERTNLDWLRRY